MTIYIDIVLLENLIMNYIILFTTALIIKLKIKNIRILLASLLGAIYSVVAYIRILELYSSMILKIILSILIVYIAYNPQNVKQLCKAILIFYLTSFVFGGAAFALIYIVKPQDIIMKNGLFLGTYPLKTVVLGTIVAFAVIITAFSIVKSKISKKALFCEIVPEKIKEEYISKLKLIPFSSLGKQNGMLIGIKAQYLKIITEEQTNEIKDVIIGIYDKSLTKKGEYGALIGLELL